MVKTINKIVKKVKNNVKDTISVLFIYVTNCDKCYRIIYRNEIVKLV